MKRAEQTTGLASNGPFVAGFILGVFAGGIAAGMWAPVSGAELRKQMYHRGTALKDQAENLALQARTTAREVVVRE